MHDTRAAYRYAKSLFELASERKEIETVNADMQLLGKVIRENRDLRVLIKSPVVKFDKKIEIFKLIFGEKLSVLTSTFINLIIKKHREGNLIDVVFHFNHIYLANNNIEEVYLTTAVVMDQEFKDQLSALVQKNTKHTIQLEETVNPDIIGGFILRFDNKQYNASVARELQLLKGEFSKNHYIKQL
jgi:F-type H+-transporting ATPase subunit delta